MKFLRLLLLPFSFIFWIGIILRNKFYDWGIIKSVKLSVPVISIGNIKVGGTGKTPFTIFITEYLLKKNLNVAVVSKGYKKTDNDVFIVQGKDNSASPKKLGDEPYLIFSRLKNTSDNFILASGGKKFWLAKKVNEKYKPDVIIIDDGFQHRKLFRNIDIVITELPQNVFDKFLLPAGNLRESKSSLQRASVVIQNNKAQMLETKNPVSIKYVSKGYFGLDNQKIRLDNAVYTLSGIANPYSFYSLINKDKLNILRKFEFPDHYAYSEDELKNKFTGIDKEKVIVTTEKDFVKLKECKNLFKEFKIVYLKIDVEFVKGKDIFENKLKEVLQCP